MFYIKWAGFVAASAGAAALVASIFGGPILAAQIGATIVGGMMLFYTGVAFSIMAVLEGFTKAVRTSDYLLLMLRVIIGLGLMILPWILL